MNRDAEVFLERVRDVEDPTPDDERRVLAAVYGAVGSGALSGVGAGASKVSKLLFPWSVPGLKIGALILGLAVAGVQVFAASRTRAPSVLRPSLGLFAKAIGNSVSAQASIPELNAPAVEVRTPPSSPSRAAPSASLRDELALLAEVQAALRRGDGAKALSLLEQHRTPDRRLLAERQAARVLALCAVGKTDEARLAGAAFLRDHAASPQRPAVERSCADPNPSGIR